MFKITYLIFLAFVIVIAVAVNIYEIRERENAEKLFLDECEAAKSARSEADILDGKCAALMHQCGSMKKQLLQANKDNAVLRVQLSEAVRERSIAEEKYEKCSIRCDELENGTVIRRLRDANRALLKRNFDDIMSLFECTIVEDGKEYYEKDGICLVVENGKCVGFYRPHLLTPSPQGEGYEAPVAEVVETEEP